MSLAQVKRDTQCVTHIKRSLAGRLPWLLVFIIKISQRQYQSSHVIQNAELLLTTLCFVVREYLLAPLRRTWAADGPYQLCMLSDEGAPKPSHHACGATGEEAHGRWRRKNEKKVGAFCSSETCRRRRKISTAKGCRHQTNVTTKDKEADESLGQSEWRWPLAHWF